MSLTALSGAEFSHRQPQAAVDARLSDRKVGIDFAISVYLRCFGLFDRECDWQS